MRIEIGPKNILIKNIDKICGFIGDNIRAQIAILSHALPSEIQDKEYQIFNQKILKSFSKLGKEQEFLAKEMMQSLKEIRKICAKNKENENFVSDYILSIAYSLHDRHTKQNQHLSL